MIKHISLSPKASVVFNYKNREGSDVSWGYDQGYKYQHTKILESITTYISVFDSTIPDAGVRVKQWDIDYKTSVITNRYLVDKISECGFIQGSKTCARPLSFSWQEPELGFEALNYNLNTCSGVHLDEAKISQVVDINSDGYNDVILGVAVLLWNPEPSESCFERPAWINNFAGNADDWRGTQAIRTKLGYALASAGKDGKELRIKTLDFVNSVATEKVIAESGDGLSNTNEKSLMIVGDENRDGLDDIYFGMFYFVQENTDNVEFPPLPLGLGGPFLNLTEDLDSKNEPTWVDIDGDRTPELFFTDPKYGLYSAMSGTEKDFFEGEIPTKNFIHYYFAVDGNERLSKYTDENGFPVDNSMTVSDIDAHRISKLSNSRSRGRRSGLYRGFADINGDGVKDLIYHTNGEWKIRIFTQDADNPFGEVQNTGVLNEDEVRHVYPYDYNKDGVLDIVDCNNRVLVSGYSGGGFAFTQIINPSESEAPFDFCEQGYNPALESIFKGDINNDGITDFFSAQRILTAKTAQPDIMAVVIDGFGAQIKFEYSTLTAGDDVNDPFYTPSESVTFPIMHASRSMQAVKTVSVSNGLNGFETQDYRYYAAKTDSHGRGFLGFEKIEVINNSKNIVTSTNFHQEFPYTKRVKSVFTGTTENTPIGEQGYIYTQIPSALGGYITYSPEAYAVTYTVNPGYNGLVSSASHTGIGIDIYGNIRRKDVKVGSTWLSSDPYAVSDIVATTLIDNEYINDPETGLIGFLERSEATYINADGDQKLVVTEYDPEPGTLDVKVQRNFLGATDENIQSTVTTTRNQKGVVTNISTSANDINGGTMAARSVTFSEFENNIFPGKITNAKSHNTFTTYKLKYGSLKTSTANGLTTTYKYDALGRLIESHNGIGNVTRSSSFYCNLPPGGITCPSGGVYGTATIVTNLGEQGIGAPLTVAYYDLLQREIRNEVYNFNKDIIKVDTQYYSTGELLGTSQPFKGANANFWTVYSNYDVLGRAQKVRHPNNGEVNYRFDKIYGSNLKSFATTTVVTPNGIKEQETSKLTNAVGQVVRARDASMGRIDYTYNPMGNLETTIVNGNTDTSITLVYDLAGNKTRMLDPDAGEVIFAYNGFGELRKQTSNPSGTAKSLTYNYDVLGRKVSRVDAGASDAASYSWQWDTTQEGMLHSVSGNGYSSIYDYNTLLQLQGETISINGLGSRTFTYFYDGFGRPTTTTYPSGLRTEQHYHAAGSLVNTTDVSDWNEPKILWASSSSSDSQGRIKRELFGNGVVTEKTYYAVSAFLHKIQTGNVKEDGTMASHIQDLTYQFDTLGNLYSRRSEQTDIEGNLLENLQETFAYDALNRLEHSEFSANGLVENTQVYGYDTLGNLTSRSDVGVLSYNQTGNAGVHAVTSANGTNYNYDNYGNLTSRGSETLSYDAFNKPTRIGSTHFTYGPNHARYKKAGEGKTTYYLAGGQYEIEFSGADVTQKTYVGGYLVQTQTSTNGEAEISNTYLHKDHLGSVDATTDDTGEYLGRSSFNAWGNRRMSNWSMGEPEEITDATTRGFTGHEMLDDLDLIHMNGRVYDPVIGRFLTADIIIQAPYNTQSYNRYSYVMNNPLSMVDPSGYEGGGCSELADACGVRPDSIPSFDPPVIPFGSVTGNMTERRDMVARNNAMLDAAMDAGVTDVQFNDGSGNKAYDITTNGGRSKLSKALKRKGLYDKNKRNGKGLGLGEKKRGCGGRPCGSRPEAPPLDFTLYAGGDVSFIPFVGATGGLGSYFTTNNENGTFEFGKYETVGGAIGLDADASLGIGLSFGSLGNFTGGGRSIGIDIGAASIDFNFNDRQEWTGFRFSINTPLPGVSDSYAITTTREY